VTDIAKAPIGEDDTARRLVDIDWPDGLSLSVVGLFAYSKLTSSAPSPRVCCHPINVSQKFFCEAEQVSPYRADPHCDTGQTAR
jgi:hypothetical protein